MFPQLKITAPATHYRASQSQPTAVVHYALISREKGHTYNATPLQFLSGKTLKMLKRNEGTTWVACSIPLNKSIENCCFAMPSFLSPASQTSNWVPFGVGWGADLTPLWAVCLTRYRLFHQVKAVCYPVRVGWRTDKELPVQAPGFLFTEPICLDKRYPFASAEYLALAVDTPAYPSYICYSMVWMGCNRAIYWVVPGNYQLVLNLTYVENNI